MTVRINYKKFRTDFLVRLILSHASRLFAAVLRMVALCEEFKFSSSVPLKRFTQVSIRAIFLNTIMAECDVYGKYLIRGQFMLNHI